jgi:putative ABC transport system permease protein
MFGYYLNLALRSLRRNPVLTVLVIVALGIGIGASMTTLTVVRAMSADPIPGKSAQLFAVELDNWGPDVPADRASHEQLSYPDAEALLRSHRGRLQTAMYSTEFIATPANSGVRPALATGRAVNADFFQMFQAPFRAGGPWTATEDAGGANVVVIGARLAQTLFGAKDAVGRSVELNHRLYRVVGVLQPWHLQPRVYDLSSLIYQQTEDVFLPLSTAIDRQMATDGAIYCSTPPSPGWTGMLRSECRWLEFWVELPGAAAVRHYQDFLRDYALEQQRLGRFHWVARVGLYDVREWLVKQNMVPASLRITTLIALGFLLVCLVNAVGLMLARFRSRGTELSIRRALGATRRHIFSQCLIEAAVTGIAGAVPGLLLAGLGLAVERGLVRADYAQFARFTGGVLLITVALAVVAAVCTGLYPAWRASTTESAWRARTL